MFANKKAVAGMEFLQEFVIGLFVVIVLIFILAIMGANLKESTSDSTAQGIITNFTTGIATLGNSVPTWVTLAGLVVLMAIMAVIIIVVKRLRGVEGGAGSL